MGDDIPKLSGGGEDVSFERDLSVPNDATYTRVVYDRRATSRELGGALQHDGLQVLASIAF